MPYIYSKVDSLMKSPLVGSGTCVDLIKVYVPGLAGKSTRSWKQGVNVMEAYKAGKTIPRGTAIATFVDGRYPQADRTGERSSRHAALLLSVMPGGIWVMDQFPGDPSRPYISHRFIRVPPPSQRTRPDGTYRDPGNNALSFYVIEQ